jgi:glycosyltransferase involved in cell wall biosynthesis
VKEAFETAQILMRNAPKMPLSKEIYDVAKESVEIENYVRAFLTVAKKFRDYDRVKTVQLFDLIPKELDDDIRIQEARSLFVPPTVWDDKSIVIYCGDSLEDWAYPSIFSGVGGSETAVIRMGEQLAKQGYVVTVYNRCGNLKGEYNGVTYKPYYHFNPKDVFNVLIGWRNPGLFLEKLTAKKKYLWLHDILYPEMINERVIENVDKIIFLSKWHSKNVPGIPDGKIFISNNGITLEDFNDLPEKRPNSLIWSSSPDRGLVPFMENIWPLIKKEIPDVTLDICYGTQNIEKEMASSPYLREVYDKCQEIFKMEGVTNHGRIPHRKLAKLMGSTMVMPYASEFGETNMISSQEAQTAGCYVIMPKDAGGAPEYVKFGKVLDIEKIYTNKEGQKLFAKEVIAALSELPPKKLVDQFSWSVTAYNWTKHLL